MNRSERLSGQRVAVPQEGIANAYALVRRLTCHPSAPTFDNHERRTDKELSGPCTRTNPRRYPSCSNKRRWFLRLFRKRYGSRYRWFSRGSSIFHQGLHTCSMLVRFRSLVVRREGLELPAAASLPFLFDLRLFELPSRWKLFEPRALLLGNHIGHPSANSRRSCVAHELVPFVTKWLGC